MRTLDGGDETPLTDVRLAAEIELLGEMIAVAASHEGRLSEREIDDVLKAGEPADDTADEAPTAEPVEKPAV
jgi:hypothetical protein